MSPFRVKINQIHKAQAGEILLRQFNRLFHAVMAACRLIRFRNPFTVKDIFNLANTDHIKALILQLVQHGAAKRLQCQVMTIAGAGEMTLAFTDKRPGDDAPHLPFILHRQLAGNLTAAIQLL